MHHETEHHVTFNFEFDDIFVRICHSAVQHFSLFTTNVLKMLKLGTSLYMFLRDNATMADRNARSAGQSESESMNAGLSVATEEDENAVAKFNDCAGEIIRAFAMYYARYTNFCSEVATHDTNRLICRPLARDFVFWIKQRIVKLCESADQVNLDQYDFVDTSLIKLINHKLEGVKKYIHRSNLTICMRSSSRD